MFLLLEVITNYKSTDRALWWLLFSLAASAIPEPFKSVSQESQLTFQSPQAVFNDYYQGLPKETYLTSRGEIPPFA